MDVADWLRQLGLDRYEAAFRENDVNAAILSSLTAEDLRELGVTSVGHRRVLLKAAATLRADTTAADDPGQLSQSQPIGLSAEGHASGPMAERRQLCVMFCDLIGSTALSSRLDPEELSAVIRGYQACVATTIARFGGFIARYVGDGVLIYFGWPEAHEANAERAVRAGLAVIDAVAQAPVRTQPLQVRIGIATGLVVIGEPIGTGEARQQTAIGETPNLAARLQNLAGPNGLVIDAVTRQQIGGLFDLRDFGTITLKGLSSPVSAWEVLGEAAIESRFEALHGGTMTPLVGRGEELDLLQRRWARAKGREGQVVLLSGEPGIGKSRVAAALDERLRDEPHTRLRYFCSPHHRDSVLYPFIAQLEHAAGFERKDSVKARLDKLEKLLARSGEVRAESVGLLADLLGLAGEDRYPPPPQDPRRRRDMILAALLGEFEGLAQQQPVLLIFEDAQWADSFSQELLDRVVERAASLPVLLIVTFRPEFLPPWTGLAHVASLSLNRLAQREAVTLVAGIIGSNSLPQVILDRIVDRADGIPLFIEELTKGLVEGVLLRHEADGSAAGDRPAALIIPSSLQDSLMARLDRLNAAKRVAQLAAIIGREFAYELLQAIALISEDELRRALRQLVDSGLIVQRGDPPRARYVFKHALIQDAAYQSLLRTQRRKQHKRVAETLKQQYPETAETRPELIAHHYTEAGLAEPAILYWRLAGERAVNQAANLEAVNHLRRALELLDASPTRVTLAEEELRILFALGPALMATMTTSAPEIRQVYGRAQQLARDTGKIPDLFATVWGSYFVGLASGNVPYARSLTEELFSIARSQDDPGLMLQAHHAAWPLELVFGDLHLAHEHLEAGLNLYRQETHGQQAMLYGGHDPAVCGYTLDALTLQILGFPDRASMQLEKGLALARELAHPPSLMHALWMGAEMRVVRCDPTNTASLVAQFLPLLSDYSASVAASNARMLRGWAMVMTGERDSGLVELREGLDRWRGTGAKLWAPYRLGRAVSAFLAAGETETGMRLLSDALQAVEAGGERWYEAELHRLNGELLLASSSDVQTEVEVCFRRALAVAHAQGARLFELRAAIALSRLRCGSEERKCRLALLGSVCDGFVEGFDAPELKEARMLLYKLR